MLEVHCQAKDDNDDVMFDSVAHVTSRVLPIRADA